MTTSRLALGQPVADGITPSVNFFNRRLLTGDDLTREQTAQAEARERLGRVVGRGVSHGLGVWRAATQPPGAAPVLIVDAGAAVASDGRVLELTRRVELELSEDVTLPDPGEDAGFADCAPLQQGGAQAGTGVHVLVIGPARTGTGRAAIGGLDDGVAPCAVGYWADGVRLRLVRVNLGAIPPDRAPQVRSVFANAVLGTTDPRRRDALVPWAFPPRVASGDLDDPSPLADPRDRWGLLDDLPPGCIGHDEVPLAALRWTAAGLDWLDMWAVRRRVTRPPAPGLGWLAGDRVRAEAEARLQQFTDHVWELAVPPAAGDPPLAAATVLTHLPPVCVVPLRVAAGAPGLDLDAFLGLQAPANIALIDAAAVPALVEEGMAHAPVAVPGAEPVRAYLVRENAAVVAADPGNRQLVAVLASPRIPYRGRERFAVPGDVARLGDAVFGPSRFAAHVD